MLHSYGVLGLAPRHLTCSSTCRNTCRYAGLIRPSVSRGIALFVGQPAMLTGLPPCTFIDMKLFAIRGSHTHTLADQSSRGMLFVLGLLAGTLHWPGAVSHSVT